MGMIPVVAHHEASPAPDQLDDVERLAAELACDRPELAVGKHLRALLPESLEDAPAIHFDDLSGIPMRDIAGELYMEERARLRAGAGDIVACSMPAVEGFEPYARDALGLGAVEWLRPPPPRGNPLRLAAACWADRTTRHRLVHAVKRNELTYLHPHMGCPSTWAFAALLHGASRRPLKLIGPPPGLWRWVNDKVDFAATVARLFGTRWRPRTEAAANLTMLARHVAALAPHARALVIKLPCSAGGEGNLVLDTASFRHVSLRAIYERLKWRLRTLRWDGRDPLLVGSWETRVLGSPSVQTWIPPAGQGPPVVEGLFDQILDGREGLFLGCTRAELPGPLAREMTTRAWLLARLFQKLGYIGRCSFDLLLVGERLETARPEFIECNGRWGGTSCPMMLLNRLFGAWSAQPFATREVHLPGLHRLRFTDLLDHFGPDLYDRRTGLGWLILHSPGQLAMRSGIQYVARGSTWDEAAQRAGVDVPERLRQCVDNRLGALV
jgi:hypothetical protein